MIETIEQNTREMSSRLDPVVREELGQFFTSIPLASFMSSMFNIPADKYIRLLDAGAGVGPLTASFVHRFVKAAEGFHCTAYEIDPGLAKAFQSNTQALGQFANRSGCQSTFELFNTDFIEDCVFKILDRQLPAFTHCIINPPYKKLKSSSESRALLSLVGIETVNLYAAFVSLGLLSLHENGELVAIIPRSFCNGKYFKSFREFILRHASISRIHLFESRTSAFKDDRVLQENIIIHLVKGKIQEDVLVSSSHDETLSDYNEKLFPFDQIVKPDNSEQFFYIPSVKDKDSIPPRFHFSLDDLGIEVSTGPIVDFRSADFLTDSSVPGTVPLLYPFHFNGTEIEWPKKRKKPDGIVVHEKIKNKLFPSGYYVVVRRFSSKEEKQRVVARVTNPDTLQSAYIGIENHLNIFHVNRKGLPRNIAYGMAAYLNSGMVDRYFRSFNGTSQVNVTDLYQIKYPNKTILSALGTWARTRHVFDCSEIDSKIIELSTSL